MTDQDFFVHQSAIVDEAASIGSDSSIWHFSHVMPGADVGKNCTLGQNVFVDSNVTIGNNVKIQNNVSVYRGVTLEDGVFCGPSMVFTNVDQPRSEYPTDESDYVQTHAGRGATIGANATIICGNDLGKWCFVGAGSVVTNYVKPHALVYGNPAQQHGWACECGKLKHKLSGFDEWTCKACGTTYSLDEDELRSV